jgi:hypothetical protein
MGVGFGVLLAAALIATDTAGLAGIMARSIGVLTGFALLATLLGMAFGFMAVATAIMLVRGPDATGGRGPVPVLVPVPVRTTPVRRP